MNKYLDFVKDDIVKTIWIINKKTKEKIGVINFYSKWNKYIFSSKSNVIFDSQCLQEIIKELDELNKGEK